MEKGVINVTVYHKPDGRKEPIEVKNIYKDDADFINDNDIKVSMEELNQDIIVYFDYGKKDGDGEPIEHIVISGNRSCIKTMKEGIEKIRELMGNIDVTQQKLI